jgi:PAS domain-containing protein
VVRAFETGAPFSRVSTSEEEKQRGIETKAYAIPLKNEEGEIWGGVEVIMDVTDLRQTENALRENAARFRTLIEKAAHR